MSPCLVTEPLQKGLKMLKTLKLDLSKKIVAAGACALFVLGSLPLGAQTGLISGHARSEARRPYYNYSCSARQGVSRKVTRRQDSQVTWDPHGRLKRARHR